MCCLEFLSGFSTNRPPSAKVGGEILSRMVRSVLSNSLSRFSTKCFQTRAGSHRQNQTMVCKDVGQWHQYVLDMSSGCQRPAFHAKIRDFLHYFDRRAVTCQESDTRKPPGAEPLPVGSDERRWQHAGSSIHPSAIVHPDTCIDDNVVVGPFCVVGKGVVLGFGCRLISHVSIQSNTIVGSETLVHPFASIGGDPQDLKYRGEESWLVLGER